MCVFLERKCNYSIERTPMKKKKILKTVLEIKGASVFYGLI